MEAIVERCAGLDVHQATVVACVLIGEAGHKPRKEIRTFPTMTRDLEALRDWLQELGVTQVGMESTGVYWKPVHAILEGHFELIVANAHHIRNVPGRKTDVKDAEWTADLARTNETRTRPCAFWDNSPSGADPEGRLIGDEGESFIKIEGGSERAGRSPGIAPPPQDFNPAAVLQRPQAGDRRAGAGAE